MSLIREGFRPLTILPILAAGTFLLLVSCAPIPVSNPKSVSYVPGTKDQSDIELERPRLLFKLGKFSEAIVQYRKLLKSKERSVAQGAQYELAYSLAYYKNPGKDYQEALNEFQLFVRKYPESSLKEEAANWASIITQYLSKRVENEKLRDDFQKLVDIDTEAEKKQKQLR